MTGNDDENLVGADVQWAWRRLGVRAEFVTGNRPSTLLDLEPEFAPAFQARCAVERRDGVLERAADRHGPDLRAL